MPLTAVKIRDLKGERWDHENVKGGVMIHRGAYLEASGGFVFPADGTGTYAGIARESCDNTAGADGAKAVEVWKSGLLWEAVTGAGHALRGANAYVANDENAATAGLIAMGKFGPFNPETGAQRINFKSADLP
ncbi:MAG: hypothetical protein QNK37_20715 [Acidobacteriota bacterium]|nr:hypothetical protein [Acidobacteriota bacterium]